MPTIYAYQNCDTCRKALKWLHGKGIAAEVKAIRETPPTVAELERALAAVQGDLRRLFNTAGGDYRELGLKDRLPAMPVAGALALLAGNGNLVKRPLFLSDKAVLVGFKPEEWEAALG